ncbi:MAG: CvpA family protein [Epsilonproteobacteria bacterium]|nr:CvpA family protein [Campylobacterota bacterium]
MEFETFDIAIVGLVLFLSLKGMVNGFTKELFNFIGLVGGIALASRANIEMGKLISDNIYHLNEPSLKLVGFIATLLGVWLIFTMVSSILETISSDDIGFLSRILGYALTVARYIAIFAIIVVGIKESEFLSQKLSKYYQNSQLFPILNEIGSQLLNKKADIEPIENKKVDDNKTVVTITNTNKNDINLNDLPLENNHTNQE